MKSACTSELALQRRHWPLIQLGELTVIRSPLLCELSWLEHAFTTRLGGSSQAPLNWFNLGRHFQSDESKADAMRNRKRLCELLGLDASRLTVPGQQHTTNIYIVDPACAAHDQRLPELDGAATDAPGYPLLLHFADCVPVMLVDRRLRIICVLHAGWKGTAGGIASAGVELLSKRWSSKPEDLAAAVGPAIGACCYPTGDDVCQRLLQSVGGAGEALVLRRGNTACPDLKAVNAMQLLQAGVADIDVCSWCTACHPEIFYSHRQSGGKTGRQAAIACLK